MDTFTLLPDTTTRPVPEMVRPSWSRMVNALPAGVKLGSSASRKVTRSSFSSPLSYRCVRNVALTKVGGLRSSVSGSGV